ncbi:oxidoreductase [Streptomyces sp. NPDC048172]|uniref:oxidoreductase n=1 Tax=Streptomyces sp. NPDC048172 TaxID=3365505 RepID=UPI003710D33E
MPAEYMTFGLAPATRAGGVLPDGAYEAHREFLDFIVDGRPLLHRLGGVDDGSAGDTVSPLAADFGPTVFTAHVRRLLLESEPPLADGRYVLYGCPECEGLDCGAVTAVIEREEEAVVWRDFAWQTDERADLERDGYPGIGPFRFHAAQYRSELERALADGAHEAPPRRVLLVGARAAVLARLANALRQTGVGAEISRDAAHASPEELRGYGAVAFGRGIGEAERQAVRAAFEAAGSDAAFVDGLAPVVPLLVAQIEQALDRSPYDLRQLVRLETADGAAVLHVGSACRVRLTAYRLDRLYRTHTHELADVRLTAGEHRWELDRRITRGESFLVARSPGSVLVTPLG